MVDEKELKIFFGKERSKSIATTRNENEEISLKKDRNKYKKGGGYKRKDLCDLLQEMNFGHFLSKEVEFNLLFLF